MKGLNLQDVFLNHARKENVPLTVFLTNGFQMRGTVRSFDSYTVLLDCDGKGSLIYKHAISTITPGRNIPLTERSENEIS